MLRRFVRLCPIFALPLLLAGCQASQSDVEKVVRDGMKEKLTVDVASTDLKKDADGNYAGTATTQGGDVFEVTAKVKGAQVEWQAVKGQPMIEKDVREALEKNLPRKVKSLQMTRTAPGTFNGEAEMDGGMRLNVSTRLEGATVMIEWKEIKR